MDQYLPSSGNNNITIDKDFLERFPIKDYQSLYRRIGESTSSLTVSNATYSQKIELIPLFANIETLILEGMEIHGLGDISQFPTSIKFLKLSQCYTEYILEPGALAKMSSSLQCLHFVGFESHKCGVYYDTEDHDWSEFDIRTLIFEEMDIEDCMDLLNDCGSTLESLTFKNIIGDISLPKYLLSLRQLNIQNFSGFNHINTIIAPSLEHFLFKGVDLPEIPLVVDSDQDHPLKTIEILTMNPLCRIENILKLKKLEQVKINCEWFLAEELRNHLASLEGIKINDVTSSFAPTTGRSLVHSVDENSLRKIISYLSEDDMYSLTLVHPKFIPLVSLVTIDKKFLETYPIESIGIYEEIGFRVRKLIISDISAIEFNQIMPHLANINSLRMAFTNEDAEVFNLELLPSTMEEPTLNLTLMDVRYDQCISLFSRLNGTLKRLDLSCERSDKVIECLNQLTNLEEFKLTGRIFKWKDFKFLRQNKNISSLDINILDSRRRNTNCQFHVLNVMSLFVDAKKIRSLKLGRIQSKESLSIILNRFKNLEHLTLSAHFLLKLFIKRLWLHKLISVTIFDYDIETIKRSRLLQLIRHFSNLREIRVDFDDSLDRKWVSKLCENLDDDDEIKYSHSLIGNNSLLLTYDKYK